MHDWLLCKIASGPGPFLEKKISFQKKMSDTVAMSFNPRFTAFTRIFSPRRSMPDVFCIISSACQEALSRIFQISVGGVLL